MTKGPLAKLFTDARKAQDDFGRNAVFDVGANRGQSYLRLRALLAEAPIHCFEPAPETFARLTRQIGDDPHAFPRQTALASRSGRARFTSGQDTGNQRIAEGAEGAANEIEVDILTGDDYCRAQGVERIDFLKIDAEGYDLDVLLGFAGMLREGRIAYLQVECATNLDNRFHVHLERFIHFLHPFNYRLYDLVEPVRRVNRTRQDLKGIWFCNAIFAREIDTPTLRRDGIN
ncbi:FkbM family methyltransferase [Albibacillus kandeliae]|uniref:FkbM family methyltransferase n=1 Tax=Albibacillus kandeliae TaxID=2174228 RepID=UPI000D69D585|nr:FkbM family methyltransferase [Albibacillus kandeliae]